MSDKKTQDTQQETAPKTGKKNKIFLIGLIVIMLAVFGGGGAFYYKQKKAEELLNADSVGEETADHETEQTENTYFVSMDRVVGNLLAAPDDPEQRDKYLAFKLNLEFFDNKDRKNIEKLFADVRPKITHAIIMTIPQYHTGNIITTQGKQEFRDQIKTEVEKLIIEASKNYKVEIHNKKEVLKSVLLEELLVQ